MIIHYGFDDFDASQPTVVTVGSFDGVHSGHRVLLSHLAQMAHRLAAASVVVTLDPHPRIAMQRAEGMTLLTTVEERALIFESCGIDHLVVAHFDEAFRSQSYETFVRESLVQRLGMRGMVVGFDHRFGKGSEGSFDMLLPLAKSCGFEVEQVAQYTDTGDGVSSTAIRNLIAGGNMRRATEMLGHPYIIIGMAQRGVVGVANSYKQLPSNGEYLSRVNGVPTTVIVDKRCLILPTELEGEVVIEFLQ